MRRFVPQADICSAANFRRGRDASYLAPPAQIRTCSFPAYGSHLGYPRQLCATVCEPASVTRLCGAESGACAAGPHSPWSPPFAPPTPRRLSPPRIAPQRIAPLCSSASQLLWRSLRPTPDCRPRRALLHLSYSYAPPCGPALLVTQCQNRTNAPQQKSHHSITVGTREQHGRRYGITSTIFRSTSVS